MEARRRGMALVCIAGTLVALAGGCEHVDKPSRGAGKDLGVGIAMAATAGLAGAAIQSMVPEPAPSRVYAKDFSREVNRERVTKGQPAPKAVAPNGQPIDVDVVPPSAVDGGISDVTATVGNPVFTASSPRVASDAVLVDAIVGSINGKPVRASEFLAPLAGTLASPLKQPKTTRDEWRLYAMKQIFDRLRTEVEGELLVSAGIAELSAQERDGLVVYMLNEKRRVVAASRGSEEAADRKLRDEGRGGLVQYLNERKRELVIQRIIELKIRPRVQISMRDIEVYYRQHPEKYDSPSQYLFRMITVPRTESKSAEVVAARLAAGDSFADVASSSLNTFNMESGGRFARVHESDKPQAESSFFGSKALNDAARVVEVRKWAGPIETDESVSWLFLDEVVDRSKTLYEAQLEIENTIRNERSQDEFRRYLTRLRDTGSYTALDQMTMRLTKIAEHQLLGPVRPGIGVDADVAPAYPPLPSASGHTFDAQEAGDVEDDVSDAGDGASNAVPDTSTMPENPGE